MKKRKSQKTQKPASDIEAGFRAVNRGGDRTEKTLEVLRGFFTPQWIRAASLEEDEGCSPEMFIGSDY
jgi:hypothetical protein